MINEYIRKLNVEKLKTRCIGKEFIILFGVLSFYCLVLGSLYWIRLIGVYNGSLWRFDLMPWNWKILCCSLAILYPLAACGLWMGSKWGFVLWLIGGLTEIVCYIFYVKYFEFHFFIPFIHVLFMISYGFLTFLKIKESRKQKETIAEY